MLAHRLAFTSGLTKEIITGPQKIKKSILITHAITKIRLLIYAEYN